MRLTLLTATALAAALPTQVTVEQSPLPATAGWNAFLVHHSPGGVWYAKVDQAVPAYGAREVIVCDDAGRLTVLSVYSGKWTERSVNPDGQWLAPSRPTDVDPRNPGHELYVAGKGGNVHRVTFVPEPFGRWSLASTEIGHAASEEFHTVLAADLSPHSRGSELLVFGISGAVYALRPQPSGDALQNGFTMELVAKIEGRVRDALVLPTDSGNAPWIVGVSRSGHVLQMRLGAERLEHRILAQEPMGMGRIARRPRISDDQPEVIYATRDDGVVLRFEQQSDASWQREAIFAGAQGLRGIAAGRFYDDPARESVAVYGYGQKVQLISRTGSGPWQVETIYSNPDRGHWLAVGELDGRNGTDELIATGFGGRVVLLARPPGYGLRGVAVDPEIPEVATPGAAATPETPTPATTGASTAERGTPERPWRIAVKAAEVALRELSPLNYQGGFETKSMVYETLVRRGADGRIVPGLASSYTIAEDGRAFLFTLREGATFHDGTPVTAADVAVHFKRWVGLPEHAWLRCNEHITGVEAIGPHRVRVALNRPYALLPDLCAINPTAIRGPGALDREGAFQRPIGSGPFQFVQARENGRVMRYRRHRPGAPAFVDLVRLDKTDDDDPLDALLSGEVDAVLGSWLVQVDPKRVATLRADSRFQVLDAPGSSMTYLSFRYSDGPTADRAVRRRIAAAVDRAELIATVEHGLADPSTGWAAPSVKIWPQGTPPEPAGAVALQQPLRIDPGRGDRRHELLAETVAAQLRRAGLPTEIAATGSPPDLRIEVTHGVPYDPFTTAVGRFTPPRNERNAQSPRFSAMDPQVVALVGKAMATSDDEARYRVFGEIQARLDTEALVVPLYAPRRVAILRAGMPTPRLDHDMYALDARWLTDAK